MQSHFNFALIFITHPGKRRFARVIVAEDADMAEKIANAMLGEEIAGQTLHSVDAVQLTHQRPSMGVFNEERTKEIWEQVLDKLGIDPDSVTVLHDFPYGEKEIVGFTKKQ